MTFRGASISFEPGGSEPYPISYCMVPRGLQELWLGSHMCVLYLPAFAFPLEGSRTPWSPLECLEPSGTL